MSRAERLLQLMQLLRLYRYPVTGARLAAELGISGGLECRVQVSNSQAASYAYARRFHVVDEDLRATP